MRLVRLDATLPVDVALVLEGGGCALHVDVARNAADAAWRPASSRLQVTWGELPTEALP